MSEITQGLTQDSITFGKYKGTTLQRMLKDRGYCAWFLQQTDMKEKYQYIYNRVQEYDPKVYFYTPDKLRSEISLSSPETFVGTYYAFHFLHSADLKLELTEEELKCYDFYLKTIEKIKTRVQNNPLKNFLDIKCPTGWLKELKETHDISGDFFKEFLASYELPNITTIIEEIKAFGGVKYNGRNAYKIAKENSLKQEKLWEGRLREKYGMDVNFQYQLEIEPDNGEKCFFDAIHINKGLLFEAKLNLKDFNKKQHDKYQAMMKTKGKYTLVYLISDDCIINTGNKVIYTDNRDKYISQIVKGKTGKFPVNLEDFTFQELDAFWG